ncbi:MAG: efflux RND transporter periplasmic adaptor subunit [candidate division WOR-3 bacterium]
MKRTLGKVIIWLGIGLVVAFVVRSFTRSSPAKTAATTPKLQDAPLRVYGRIEPGGEVYVSAPVTGRVAQILVAEGALVKKGDVICQLDGSVEQAQLAVAQANVVALERARAIDQDRLRREESLYARGGVSEAELTQSRLALQLDDAQIEAGRKQVELAQAQLERLALRAPTDGRVYKLDIRVGQTLAAGDNSRIVLGRPDLQVRLFVEAWWSGRVDLGDEFRVFDAETGELIGTARVSHKAPYLGKRSFRTDDPRERFDTNYMEVVLEFLGDARTVPVGTTVTAERASRTR